MLTGFCVIGGLVVIGFAVLSPGWFKPFTMRLLGRLVSHPSGVPYQQLLKEFSTSRTRRLVQYMLEVLQDHGQIMVVDRAGIQFVILA